MFSQFYRNNMGFASIMREGRRLIMHKRIWNKTVLLLCTFAVILLSGCRVNISIGTDNYLTGEEYPDAEKYQAGAFT